MKTINLKTLVSILIIIALVFAFQLSTASAATQYVTMQIGGGGSDGAMTVYKDQYCINAYTLNGYESKISRNVYVTYQGVAGDCFKISWGGATGYVKRNQAQLVETKPSNTTALSANKKVAYGVYNGYIAKGTYVIYSSTNKIMWASYCNGNCTNESSWVPAGPVTISSI